MSRTFRMWATQSVARVRCGTRRSARPGRSVVGGALVKSALALVGACLGAACGDGPAPEQRPPPPWAASDGRGVPAWQSGESPISAHWEYDADGAPSGQGVGSPVDGLYGSGSGTGGEPVGAGAPNAGAGSAFGGGAVGAGAFTTGDLNFVTGCDWQQDLYPSGERSELSIHLCMDIFLNLPPSYLASYGSAQLCPTLPVDTAVGLSSLDVTPLPAGCDGSGAVGSCSATAELPQGLRARYDVYYYDERAYDEESCETLAEALGSL